MDENILFPIYSTAHLVGFFFNFVPIIWAGKLQIQNFHFFDEKKLNIIPCFLGISFCSTVNVPSCLAPIYLSLRGAAGF